MRGLVWTGPADFLKARRSGRQVRVLGRGLTRCFEWGVWVSSSLLLYCFFFCLLKQIQEEVKDMYISTYLY